MFWTMIAPLFTMQRLTSKANQDASIQDLSNDVLEEMEKPDCFSYLRYPQMYAENECYSCPWLNQCQKESGKRWNTY